MAAAAQTRPEPFQTREETSKYTLLMPDGVARQFNFVMEAKSVITFPSGGQLLREKGFYEISGLAWSGHGRSRARRCFRRRRRELDAARLQEPVLPQCLTRFRLAWRGTARRRAAEPGDRRDRLCAADLRSAAQRARRAVLLSLQRNSEPLDFVFGDELSGETRALAFSPDGKQFASAAGSRFVSGTRPQARSCRCQLDIAAFPRASAFRPTARQPFRGEPTVSSVAGRCPTASPWVLSPRPRKLPWLPFPTMVRLWPW